MSQIYTAASQKVGYIPAFTVEKLEGKYEKTIAYHNGKEGKGAVGLEYKTDTVDKGWLVTFPVKHGNLPNSIHIETMAELKRMGFDRTTIPLVDEDGETVGSVPNRIRTKRVSEDA